MAVHKDVEQTTTIPFWMLAMVGTNREGLKETIANSTGEGRTGTERLLQLHANILCSAAERRESSQLGLAKKGDSFRSEYDQCEDFHAYLEDTKGCGGKGDKDSLFQRSGL